AAASSSRGRMAFMGTSALSVDGLKVRDRRGSRHLAPDEAQDRADEAQAAADGDRLAVTFGRLGC
ncbi:MAG TPA: hypothetical protein VIN03_08365, partial [Roseateles sp.]